MSSPSRKLTFDDHRRELRNHRYVYPVLSRRAKGISIGINLNPDKACNFDCIYCQVDRNRPGFKGVDPDLILQELAGLLHQIKEGTLFGHPPFEHVEPHLQRVNDISFSGDGEPTTAREFPTLLEKVIHMRDEMHLPHLKLILITNATRFHRPKIREALLKLAKARGEVWGKLDAGTEGYYQKIDVSHVPFAQILSNLQEAAHIAPLTLQSLFIALNHTPPPPEEIEAYIDRIRTILASGGHIRAIQVHTIARKPPHAHVHALPNTVLDALAQKIRAGVRVPVEVYYGHPKFMRAQGETKPPSQSKSIMDTPNS